MFSFFLDSDYYHTLAEEWVLHQMNNKTPMENEPQKYMIASWYMAAGFESPAVIVVTRNLDDVCNQNFYLRAKANLVIYHIPNEPESMPGLENNQPDEVTEFLRNNIPGVENMQPHEMRDFLTKVAKTFTPASENLKPDEMNNLCNRMANDFKAERNSKQNSTNREKLEKLDKNSPDLDRKIFKKTTVKELKESRSQSKLMKVPISKTETKVDGGPSGKSEDDKGGKKKSKDWCDGLRGKFL